MLIKDRSKRLRVISAFVAILFIALCSAQAFAQFESATLTGVVTDPVSAVVPGADIRAVNVDTNQETATTTKTSRLPEGNIDRACKGQGWGSESVECLTMIARENGRSDLKVRLIADAAPGNLNTPNIF